MALHAGSSIPHRPHDVLERAMQWHSHMAQPAAERAAKPKRVTSSTRRIYYSAVRAYPFVCIHNIIPINMSLKRKAVDLAADAAKKPKANASITAFFGQPKVNASSSAKSNGSSQPASSPAAAEADTPAVAKFDKDAWVAKLSAEQRELLKLEIETLDESWLAVLKDEVASREFLDLKKFLRKEAEAGKTIYPPSKDVYSW